MTKEKARKILVEYVKACRKDDMLTLEQFEYEDIMEAMSMGAEALLTSELSEDLEAEMGKYFDGWYDDPEYGQAVIPHTYECVGVSDCKDIARHFYELGKQSKEPVNEDLEAKAAQYESYFDVGEQHGYLCVNKGEMAEAFKDGARWQKDQFLKGDRLTELDKSYKQAKRELEWFKEGKRQGREQMMKEVTECELVCFKDHLLAVLPMKEFRWTAGDKVKIIIVKEDKK